jgi:hypothetical protein
MKYVLRIYKHQTISKRIYLDWVIAVDFASKQFLRQVVEQQILNGSLYRASTKLWVEACIGKIVDGMWRYLESEALWA